MRKLSGPITLIKEAFQIFFEKKNMIFFFKIYALLVPFAIFSLYQDSLIKISTSNLNLSEVSTLFAQYGWLFGLSVIVNLAYLVISFWIGAAGIKAVTEAIAGGNLDVKSTLGFAWKKLWLFSVLSIIIGLITGVGFLLLIIPGIIFLVWFRFSSFEFMTKDAGVKASISNSKRLVSGRFWPVFGRILIFGLFTIIFEAILGAIPLGLGSAVLPLFGALFILPYFLLYRELQI